MIQPRLILLCFLLSLGRAAAVDIPDSALARFEGRQLTPVEGLWLWNSGALVAIEADSRGAITLTLVASPDPLVTPPLVIGKGVFGGAPSTYNLELNTLGNASSKPKIPRTARFTAKIAENRRLSLSPYSSGLKINAWRLIPYLFRFSVSKEKSPGGLDGAIRVWPPLGTPEFPVIL